MSKKGRDLTHRTLEHTLIVVGWRRDVQRNGILWNEGNIINLCSRISKWILRALSKTTTGTHL
jgi:hypothetical protein